MTLLMANQPDFANEEGVRQFLQEIRSVPMLTAEEERELARRCAQGDEEAIDQMVSANMRLVVAIARRYSSADIPLPDLIQEGSIGLMAAAKRFDYTMNYRFSTYASKWIRQRVLRYIAENHNQVRIPVHMVDKIRKVTQIQKALQQELEREPTLAEIADRIQLPEEKVAQLLQLQPQLVSLDAPLGEENAIGDLVEDVRSPKPMDALVQQELLQTMDKLLSTLNARQQQILRLHYGLEDGVCHSLEEIGGILGISKERARQIERQAMRKLKALAANNGLEDYLE